MYKGFLSTSILPYDIYDFLDQKKEFSKIPVIAFCGFIIFLYKNKLLNDIVINEIGNIGKYCGGKINEHPIYKEAFEFILNTLNFIKKEVEEKLDNNISIYYYIYEEISSMKISLKEDDKELEKKVNNILKEFKKIEEIKEKMKINNINWPSYD